MRTPLAASLLALLAASALPATAQTIDRAAGRTTTEEAAPRAAIPADVRETARALMAAALEDDTGYRVVEDLTTEIGPRLAGSKAEARARAWSADRLEAMGFSNVRVEPFRIPYWARVYERAAITEPFPQTLMVTALGNSVGTEPGGVTGEVVRFESLDDLIEAPMDDALSGRVVFVDEGMTRTQDGSGYGQAVRKRSGAANEAAKRGAVAALIRSVGTDRHRFPHTGVMRYADGVTPIPIAALSWPDAEQLMRAMERGSVSVNLDLEVVTQEDAPSGNVIAEIPGTSDEIVVIGAHLDSWDLGTGAVDDGAGVGIVVGAAKTILDHTRATGEAPLRTIRVVLFGAEEVGLFGAYAYAEAHADEIARHAMGAESDFGAGRVYRLEPNVAEERLDAMREVARVLQPLGIAPGPNTGSGGPDMGPLRQAGVPVATLKQNGWDYFDLHHTHDDTLDKIEPEALAQNVAAYAGFAWMAANAPAGFRAPIAAEPSR